MTVRQSTTVRNAKVDAVETAIGVSPILKIRTGAQPATFATASSGTVLASLTLPSDWLTAGSGGVKSKNGTWSGTASGTGTAAHYEIYAADGTTLHERGDLTLTGGGGDATIDNTSIVSGQTVTVSTWTVTAGNP